MIKHLLIAICIVAGFAAQAQHTTQRELMAVDYLNYFETTRHKIAIKLYREIAGGHFTAYKDIQFRNPCPLDEFLKYGNITEEITDKNDANYGYTISIAFEPELAKGFALYDERILVFRLTDKDSVFVDYSKAKSLLTAEQQNLFDFFRYRKKYAINYNTSFTQAKKEFDHLAMLTYTLGNNGTLKAYQNDSLTSTYTPEGIKKRLTGFNYIEIYPNPKDSTIKYDSTVYFSYHVPDSTEKIRLLDGWEQKGNFSAHTKLLAIAPTFNPLVAGLALPATPVFWLKTEDILPHLAAEEISFYNYFLYYHQKNASTMPWKRDFIYEKEQKLFGERGY